jgi:folate-dependent phosphoribosylglycinamide formyltransferase PurN
MAYKLLFNSKKQPMRVACFMSGSGTNVRKILEYQVKLKKENGKSPYEVVVIFTDNPESNAKKIAEEYGISLVVNDIKAFYHDKDIKDKSVREEFDKKAVELIKPYKVDLIALCGYAWFVTKPLLSKYIIVNVHPADLSVKENGKRKYVGLYHIPVMKAIFAGEKYLHSSTHIVIEDVDMGEILVVSKPLKVELPEGFTIEYLKKSENKELMKKISEEHQNKLKEVGDWEIFPLTLEWIAEGRFGIDEKGNIYFDGKLIKNGYRLK